MTAATGAVATSDPRASEVGARVLDGGGNAVDAAVAAMFVLFVVEPHHCGLGGDAFVLWTSPGGPPRALDGSGAMPTALVQEAARAGDAFVPVERMGPRSVTPPGALDLLVTWHATEGSQPWADLLGPAIELAAAGFAVRPTLAAAAVEHRDKLAADPVLGPLYAPGGEPVPVDAVVRNPALARSLAAVADGNVRSLYDGPLAAALAETVAGAGGLLGRDDLRDHRTRPLDPCSGTFRDHVVHQLPEPTQGPAVLHALELLDGHAPITDDDLVEALIQGAAAVGLDLRPGRVPAGAHHERSDTSYVAACDARGTTVSLIASIFTDFGAGVGVAELGSPLQNRAYGTTLLQRRPSAGKPPHTTIPGLVVAPTGEAMALGVVGGYMQAQGQVQVLVHLLAEGLDVDAAIDAPRVRVTPGGRLALEPGHPLLDRHPDGTEVPPGPGGFGAASLAGRRDGRLVAGADHRRHGAVGWSGEPDRG